MRTRAKTSAGESKIDTGIFTKLIITIVMQHSLPTIKLILRNKKPHSFYPFKDLAMTPPWPVSATVFVPNITTAARTIPSSVQVQDQYDQQCDRWRA